MPKTANTSTKKSEVDLKVNSNLNNDELLESLKKEQEKNNYLENKLDLLMSMVQNLTNKQNNIPTPEDTIKPVVKKALDSYKDIESTRRVLLMNMIDAGGTYITHSGKSVRFDYQGQVQPMRFEDIESLRNKYRNAFENLEIRILDDDEVINALYLKTFYDKYKISFEDIENIMDLDEQSMIKRIKSLPKSLQEATLCSIIAGVSRKDAKYLDKNKWTVINNEYNIDIENLAQTYYTN